MESLGPRYVFRLDPSRGFAEEKNRPVPAPPCFARPPAKRRPPAASRRQIILGDTSNHSFMATVGGRNPFRTTLKRWETIVCWYLQGNHHSRVSWVVQDIVHPQYGGGWRGTVRERPRLLNLDKWTNQKPQYMGYLPTMLSRDPSFRKTTPGETAGF